MIVFIADKDFRKVEFKLRGKNCHFIDPFSNFLPDIRNLVIKNTLNHLHGTSSIKRKPEKNAHTFQLKVIHLHELSAARSSPPPCTYCGKIKLPRLPN